MIKSITVIGPFATEYSLAKVNRALALALCKAYPETRVRLWADNEYCDRLPGAKEYAKYPFLKDLYDESVGEPEVVIFNNFPKSLYAPYGLKDLPGKVKLAYLAWEESIFPKRWVEECNQYLHGLLVPSEHVRRIFANSGISIPMQVVSEGLDIPFAKPEKFTVATKKTFKFLHVSSGQYRKGVDVLIKAYLNEFTSKDDVSLILKLFPNASTAREIDAFLADRTPESPEVVLIRNGEITDGELRSLYDSCSAMVLPSRAEGFGIPMAEALALGKPLITTGYSGQTDFCNDKDAFLVDFQITDSHSHLNIAGAKVAEPDQASLQKQMRYLYENIDSAEVKAKVATGLKATARLRWENSAAETMAFAEQIDVFTPLKQLSLAVVSTWNSRCGVAVYSKDMYCTIFRSFKDFKIYANSDIGDRTAEDEPYVERVWQYGEMDFNKLMQALDKNKPDILHFQYNLSFYSPLLMGKIIKECAAKGIRVYATLHSVHPGMQQAVADLNQAEAILVHAREDKRDLEAWGVNNVKMADHGLPDFQDEDRDQLAKRIGLTNRPVLASHGMIHDKKGVFELVQSIEILKKELPDILLIAATAVNPNNSTSAAIYEQIKAFIAAKHLEKNVFLIPDFLEAAEIIKLLHLSDLVVLPYADVKEGASGAVRYCIAAKRALIISDSYIFRDLACGFRIKDNRPETIAAAVLKLWNNTTERAGLQAEISTYAGKHHWREVSLDYLKLLAAK